VASIDMKLTLNIVKSASWSKHISF